MIPLESAEATRGWGRRLAHVMGIGDVVVLSGSLGAGKTELARGVLEGLGFLGDVPSPSFPIVIGYAPPDVGLPIAHVDLYRIDDLTQVEELGLDEMLADGALVVEWPERLPKGYWPEALHLSLEIASDDARRLTARVPPAWEGRWPLI